MVIATRSTPSSAPRVGVRRGAVSALGTGLIAGWLAGCAPAERAPTAPPPTVPPPAGPQPPAPPAPPAAAPLLERTVVATGLANPWDLAFAADGTLFYTERCRGLSVRRPDGSTARLWGTSGAATLADDLVCLGQSGVHGVALDPAFATTRTLFVFFASNRAAGPRTNRVARLVLDAGWTRVTDRTDIVTDIAFKEAATANGGAGAHSGGRLRVGPDGFLYVATGDNHDGALPQHPTRLGGKVLRVTRDGAAAAGNNAPAGFDARIYGYGFRNVQGLAFRPGTGQPFIAEHGPNHSDEVTALVAGGNGGWDPQNRPALGCPGGYCGYAGSASTMPMTDVTRFPDALRPSWQNNGASQGLGPATFLTGTSWKGWDGRLLVGIMGGQRLELLTLDAEGRTTAAERVSLPAARYRALVQAPDGALWVATDAGELWRVVPR
jgi:glucose/arabinose dehydrogenase